MTSCFETMLGTSVLKIIFQIASSLYLQNDIRTVLIDKILLQRVSINQLFFAWRREPD